MYAVYSTDNYEDAEDAESARDLYTLSVDLKGLDSRDLDIAKDVLATTGCCYCGEPKTFALARLTQRGWKDV